MTTLEMYRGDAREIEVTLTLGGVDWEPPIDATIRATAKRRTKDTDLAAVWAKHNDSGGTITVSTNVVTIPLEAEDTEDCSDERAELLYVDVQVASATIGPWTVAAFKLKVIPDITRTQP